MNKLICPYCKKDNDVPEECYEQDYRYECECDTCNQLFMFIISYLPFYEEIATPCLNNDSHKWEKICGAPKEFFVNKRQCKICGKRKTLTTSGE